MEAVAERSEWTFVQKGVLVIAAGLTAWSLAGLLANPDFATGSDATAKQVLGVDFNGWHAVSGFLLTAPAFVAMLRRSWALAYALYAGFVLMLTAVWALADTQPANLLAFPNNESDAILHFAFAVLFLGVAAVEIRRERIGAANSY